MVTHLPDDELRRRWATDALDALSHKRCGPRSKCRRDAITRCDEWLDAWLERHSPKSTPVKSS